MNTRIFINSVRGDTDVASATVFAPEGSDNGNQYLVVLSCQQEIRIIPGLCGKSPSGENQVAFMVVGDWEMFDLAKALQDAVSGRKKLVLENPGRDWLISDDRTDEDPMVLRISKEKIQGWIERGDA